jgi:predicted component of type VI protein secretion system
MRALGTASYALHLATAAYEFRLYHSTEPDRVVATRQLREGAITLGRDPGANWIVEDTARTLSRRHCEFALRPAGLVIRVSGVNGVFANGEKLPFGVETILAVPCTLLLGDFRLTVCCVAEPITGAGPGLVPSNPTTPSPQEIAAFSEPAYEAAAANRSLLEAFCEGAGLDSSLLAGEEPDEIMRRVGAIYHHTVIGVRDLMADRDRTRGQYDLQRTKIGGTGNNMFKWASTQRLAADLLLTGPAGFLSGPEAVRSSLRAIKRHIAASQSGMQGCLRAIADMFSPGEIHRAVPDGAAAKMDEVVRRHAEIVQQLDGAEPSSLIEVFALSYGTAEAALRKAERGDALKDISCDEFASSSKPT